MPNSKLISPVPQRAYAFAGLFDGENNASRNASVACGGASGLARPASAPAGGDWTSTEVISCLGLERPSSPLSRVTNPMVRDTHFRRGLGVERYWSKENEANERRQRGCLEE